MTTATASPRYRVDGFPGLIVRIVPRSKRHVTGGTVVDVRVVEAPADFLPTGWTENFDHLQAVRA